mgnify:CR=1 FL=1
MNAAARHLSRDGGPAAAEAIMTTDTVPKEIGTANQPIGRWGRQYGSTPEAVSRSATARAGHDVSVLDLAFSKQPAKDTLQRVVKEYPKSNRAGSAILYLALTGTPHGRALMDQSLQVVPVDGASWLLAPVTSRGEAVGLLELRLREPPDEQTLVDVAQVDERVVAHELSAGAEPRVGQDRPDQVESGNQPALVAVGDGVAADRTVLAGLDQLGRPLLDQLVHAREYVDPPHVRGHAVRRQAVVGVALDLLRARAVHDRRARRPAHARGSRLGHGQDRLVERRDRHGVRGRQVRQ